MLLRLRIPKPQRRRGFRKYADEFRDHPGFTGGARFTAGAPWPGTVRSFGRGRRRHRM